MASSTERPYLDEATTEQLQQELERRSLRDRYKDAQELYQAAVLINSYGRQPHLWSALLKVAPACFGEWSVKDTSDLSTILSGVEAMAKHVVTAYEHLIDDQVGIPLELRDSLPLDMESSRWEPTAEDAGGASDPPRDRCRTCSDPIIFSRVLGSEPRWHHAKVKEYNHFPSPPETPSERISAEVIEKLDEAGDTYVPDRVCKYCNGDQEQHRRRSEESGGWHAYHPVENVSRLRFPTRSIP